MTYDEWRESYFSGQLMNEAMARAAWDFAVLAEREACAQIGDGYDYGERNCGEEIRARGNA